MMTPQEELSKRTQLVADYGIANAADIVQAHARVGGITLSECLAMIENETFGRNEFGGEGTATPRAWYEQPVTQARYTVYKLRRRLGFTVNGVGPTQITDTALQIEAEKLGGCWKPLHNCEVGFRFLANLITTHGQQAGFTAYNDAYGARATERANTWHFRFVKAGLA
jgi:hypothetical protein